MAGVTGCYRPVCVATPASSPEVGELAAHGSLPGSPGPDRIQSCEERPLRGATLLNTHRPHCPALSASRPAQTCCAGWAAFEKSRAAYDKAIELVGNTAETASLTRRRDQLG
jgi:hypothetical protein